jgi:hypothetical protein
MYQDTLKWPPCCFDEKLADRREHLSVFLVISNNSRRHSDTRQLSARRPSRFCPWIGKQEIKMAPKARPQVYKRVKIRKGLREYTYLGCPMTKNRSPWCFRMCKPKADGTGFCGRVAPHGFKSRIQQGIEEFNRRRDIISPVVRYQKPVRNEDAGSFEPSQE